MDIRILPLAEADQATGLVVVVDVIRAFTTAAFACAAGASSIALVEHAEDAWELRQRFPESLLIGEVDGRRIPGFDFGNSPEPMAQGVESGRFSGTSFIQRTTHGTRGVVRAQSAKRLFAGSMVVASGTAAALRTALDRVRSSTVTYISTGTHGEQDGEEDIACAEYIHQLVLGTDPDPNPYLDRIRRSSWAQRFSQPDDADFPTRDLDRCCEVSRFPFVLEVFRTAELLILRSIKPAQETNVESSSRDRR